MPQASNRSARNARWATMREKAALNKRNSVVDWADKTHKKLVESKPRAVSVDAVSLSMPVGSRACTRDTGITVACTCRECVFARWSSNMPPPGAANARTAIRHSPQSSDPENTSSSDDGAGVFSARVSSSSNASTPRNSLYAPFSGFGLAKAVDHFGPLNGQGPTMTVEARDLTSGATEQILELDMIKCSVVEQLPPPGSLAIPETLVTVSKRCRTSPGLMSTSAATPSTLYETVYVGHLMPRGRAQSVEQLADTFDRQPHAFRTVDSGAVENVAALLESVAQNCGTTSASLVEAVKRVVPFPLGSALEAMC